MHLQLCPPPGLTELLVPLNILLFTYLNVSTVPLYSLSGCNLFYLTTNHPYQIFRRLPAYQCFYVNFVSNSHKTLPFFGVIQITESFIYILNGFAWHRGFTLLSAMYVWMPVSLHHCWQRLCFKYFLYLIEAAWDLIALLSC